MSLETLSFYSHGKLLLTGEYLIMYGARALAVPVVFGQKMNVSASTKGLLTWRAFIQNNSWFEAKFNFPDLTLVHTSDNSKALYLMSALLAARNLNAEFLSAKAGYAVTTNLEYPQEWGLGSSSTFISNLAQWAKVDPLQLHHAISSGSGYDVACAQASSPILFEFSHNKPAWRQTTYFPSYHNHLFFVFLENKQETNESVQQFKKEYRFNSGDIDYMAGLTDKFINAASLEEAIVTINEHESFMSSILKLAPLKQRLFTGFNGAVKSLGAWGGDFMMVASSLSAAELKLYFNNKGYHTVYRFDELVLGGK